MKCTNCGQELPASAKFCFQCGSEVPAGIHIDINIGDLRGDATGAVFNEPAKVPGMNVDVGMNVDTVEAGGSLTGLVWGQPASPAAGPAQPPQDPYLDVEIAILPKQGDAYPVEITLAGEAVFRGKMEAGLETGQFGMQPEQLGTYLFARLFQDAGLLQGWTEARGRSNKRRLRLNIHPDAPELHQAAWETLQEGGTWLSASAQTPFSRYLPVEQAWGQPASKGPARILVAISNPDDLATYGAEPIEMTGEQYRLQTGLEEIGSAVQLEFLEGPVTLARLEDRLRSGYHILHFIGHGKFSAARSKAALLLQKETGQVQIVEDLELADVLNRLDERPGLVFLTTCESASRATNDAFMGLAPLLVRRGVPAVIAMQGPLSMRSGKDLNEVFYKRLMTHGTVDLALNEARSRLLTLQRVDRTVPVLFMRLRSGRLWR